MITAKNYRVLKINLRKEEDKLTIATHYKSPFTFNGQPILISQVRSRFLKTKGEIRERWFVRLENAAQWIGSFQNLGDALDVYRK